MFGGAVGKEREEKGREEKEGEREADSTRKYSWDFQKMILKMQPSGSIKLTIVFNSLN